MVGFGAGEDASAGFQLLPGHSTKGIVFETFSNIGKSFAIRARFTNTTDASDRFGIQSAGRSKTTYSGGSKVAFRTVYGPSWNAPFRTTGNDLADIVQAALVRTNTIDTVTPPVYESAFKGVGPGAFTGKYLLFTFMNSDVGKVNYGWIHLASATRSFSGDKKTLTSLSVTFDRWAYQDDGSTIMAGQTAVVPEPSTAASLAMGGALVAGAAGLRAWRKRR